MDLKDYLLFLTALLSSILGLFIYFKNKERLINQLLALIAFCNFIGAVAIIFFRLAETEAATLTWSRIVYIIPLFTLGFTVLFSLVFPFRTSLNKKLVIWIFSLLSAVSALVLFTGLIIKGVNIAGGQDKIINFGFLYYVYALIPLGLMLWSYVDLFRTRSETNTLVRQAVSKIFLLILAVTATVYTLSFLLPLTDYYALSVLSPMVMLVLLAFAANTVAQQRMMSFKLALRSLVVYFMSLFIIIAPFIFIHQKIIQLEYEWIDFLYLIVAIPLFPMVKIYFTRLANKYLFLTYDAGEVLENFTNKAYASIDLEKIYQVIVETITKTFGVDAVAILIREKDTIYFSVQHNHNFKIGDKVIFRGDDRLRKAFIESKRCIVTELLNNKEFAPQRQVYNDLTESGVAVVAPMPLKSGSVGLIPVGPKLNGQDFNYEELELLAEIGTQAADAIENAMLHNEIKDLNFKLEQEIRKLTRDLRDKNDKMQKLEEARADIYGDSLKTE